MKTQLKKQLKMFAREMHTRQAGIKKWEPKAKQLSVPKNVPQKFAGGAICWMQSKTSDSAAAVEPTF